MGLNKSFQTQPKFFRSLNFFQPEFFKVSKENLDPSNVEQDVPMEWCEDFLLSEVLQLSTVSATESLLECLTTYSTCTANSSS